jgi:glycosyltransferase involved in cell wall biosynthesis
MNDIKITVIVPVHKDHKYWQRCLNSVINQDYPDKELIISVNSKEFPIDKLQDFLGNQEIKIRILDSTQKKGVSWALNCAIQASESEYVAWLSSDDYWDRNYLSEQYLTLKNSDKKFAMSICGIRSIGLDDKIISEENFFDEIGYESIEKKWEYFFGVKITGCSALIKKDVFSEIGYFDESLLYTQDYDIWYKIISKYDLKITKKILVNIQIHDEQTTEEEDVSTEIANLWRKIIDDRLSILEDKKHPELQIINFLQIFSLLHPVPYESLRIVLIEKLIRILSSQDPQYSFLTNSQVLKVLDVSLDVIQSSSALKQDLFVARLTKERNDLGLLAHGYRQMSEELRAEINSLRKHRFIMKMLKISSKIETKLYTKKLWNS